jgi:hypothetical protein
MCLHSLESLLIRFEVIVLVLETILKLTLLVTARTQVRSFWTLVFEPRLL